MATVVVPQLSGYHRPAVLDWLTTVDHKKLGILYLYFTLFFFAVGGVLALLVRTQLAVADNSFVGNDLYNQIFTICRDINCLDFSNIVCPNGSTTILVK